MWLALTVASMVGLVSIPAAAAPAVDVPFDFLHNQIVLQATVAGRGPFNFILDTGTNSSTIDLDLARELRLPLGAQGLITGAGTGRATGRRTVIPELKVGDLVAHNLDAAAVDLSKIANSLGRPLHGVLGFGFLRTRVTQIDYFHRRIRFLAGAAPRNEPSSSNERAISFPIIFGENSVLPVIEDAYVNGARLSVTLDTGSSLGLVLFPRTIDMLGLREAAERGIPMKAAGYLGNAHLTKGWVVSVKLSAIDLNAIEVAYIRKGYGDDEKPGRRGGSIGNAVLQDFVLTLDYPGRVVTLEKTVE